MDKEIELGKVYQDTITGFVGTATAKAKYLHGTPQALLEGSVVGQPFERWVAVERLQLFEG